MKVQINISDKVRRAAIAQGHELPATMVLAIDPASLPEDLREHAAPILPLFEPGRVAPLLHGSRNPADEGVLEDWARAGMPRTPWQCSADPAVGTEAVLRAWIADRAAKERSYAAEKARHEAADAAARAEEAAGKAAAIAAIAAGGAVEVCGDGSGGHYIMADRYRLTSADIPAEVWARIVSEYKARCAEAEARRAAEEEAKRQGKAAFVAEAKAWAEEHGSDRLRKGLAQNYDMTRLYVVERVAAEHPGFLIDWKNECEWDRRSSPSERALDVAAEHDGEVVWLETLPDGAETTEEAVVIREYLGRYDLVMPMGDPEEA